ncbi:MAG: HEPN domain-containing protein [Nanoarchaeota archaeon]
MGDGSILKSAALKKIIEAYLKKEQLEKNDAFARLKKPFLAKARKNIAVARLLMGISGRNEFKEALGLPSDFDSYDWVVIIAYYSMYVSSLAALANLSLKSRSHAATLAVLEYEYVLKKKLDEKHLQNLSNAFSLSEEMITRLMQAKTNRETAQYDATPEIARQNAISALEYAEEFITRVEEILH